MTTQELQNGNWNGKVYGRKQYNSCNIYLNNEKINITNEQAEYLESLNYTPVYKKSVKSNNTREGGHFVKGQYYEDEFNAALGIVG